MPITEIRAEGLKQLRSALKKADSQFPVALGKAHRSIVETLIIPQVQSAGRALGRPRVSSRSIASVRGSSSSAAAKLLAGGNQAPELRGSEWGSVKHRQFRGVNPDGYWIRPTIKRLEPQFAEEYMKALDGLIKGIAG